MSATDDKFDLIVVGAGPAGSAAAYFAARPGLRVLLLDENEFPRHKICSGGLSPKSLLVLEKMGVLPQIEASSHPKISRVRIGSPSGLILEGDVPVSPVSRGYGYVVPRIVLDDMLRKQAINKGVRAERARVSKLLMSDGEATGVVAGGREIQAKAIIIAAGAKSASLIGQNEQRPGDAKFYGIQSHCEAPSELSSDTIEIYFERSLVPGYFWIFPDAPDRLAIGAGVWVNPGGVAELRERFEAGVRFAKRAGGTPIPALDSLTFEKWVIPANRDWRTSIGPNVLLAGDAGAFARPFSGEGIYYALETGRLAGETVADNLNQASATSSIGETFNARLSEVADELRISWSLHDLMSDADRVDALVGEASGDDALRSTMIGTIVNALDKRTLASWSESIEGQRT